jgi:hypothetical protein
MNVWIRSDQTVSGRELCHHSITELALTSQSEDGRTCNCNGDNYGRFATGCLRGVPRFNFGLLLVQSVSKMHSVELRLLR